jgi:hypothetical protein
MNHKQAMAKIKKVGVHCINCPKDMSYCATQGHGCEECWVYQIMNEILEYEKLVT